MLLTKAFLKVLTLPHISSQTGKSFEEAIKEVLGSIGKLGEVHVPSKGRVVRQQELIDAKSWIYVPQPNGTQQAPDLMLYLMGHSVVPVEIKRSNNGKIMWNSGIPSIDTVYIYNGCSNSHKFNDDGISTGEKWSGTTFILGGDIIQVDEISALRDLKVSLNKLKRQYNEASNSRWILMHIRPMFSEQNGRGARWLENPNRYYHESRVLAYIRKLEERGVPV